MYEYREADLDQPVIEPDQLSSADKLNGIQWRGKAIWTAGAYRIMSVGDRHWSEWKDTSGNRIDPLELLKNVLSGKETLAGNLIFFLEEKRNRWSVRIASLGLLGITQELFDPDAVWSSRMSCEAANSSNPLASARDTAQPLPEQQRQFCSVFQEDEARRQKSRTKVTGAGSNPIAQRLAEKDQPDFDRLFRAQEFAVIGNGAFQNWVGEVSLAINNDKAYIAVGFPCAWTNYRDEIFHPRYTTMYFGNGFDPSMPGLLIGWYGTDGFPVTSPEGKSLARLKPGEMVTVSAVLACTSPAGFNRGGCNVINGVQPNYLWATITYVHSDKEGTILGSDDAGQPAEKLRRPLSVSEKGSMVLYQSDDFETLKQKVSALMAQKPTPEIANLQEYLNPPLNDRENRFGPITFRGYDLDTSGRPVLRTVPCPPRSVAPLSAETLWLHMSKAISLR